MKDFFRKILCILMLILVIFAGGMGCAMFKDTLAAWWIPVGVALVIAVVTLPFSGKWKWLTAMEGKLVNVLCHLVFVGTISFALFISGNSLLADPASTHDVTVTVLRKYIEQHEKRRKIRKYHWVSNGMRYTYYLEVAFDDGKVVTLRTSPTIYSKANEGKPKVLVVRKGFFGLTVIKGGI